MVAVLSALGVTAVLGGCGVTGGSDPVTLRLVAADYGDSAGNSSKKYWDALVEAYEKDHPDVRVEVSVYSWTDVDRKVKEMVDADKAPDLAQIGAYADYAKADKLYTASELLSITTQANFLPQLASAGAVKGEQYGMPFASSTRLLFYNKDLFAQAGLQPPKTWAELKAAAAALKADGVKFPYALPLGPEEAQAETMQWLLSGGGGYTDTNAGIYSIDDPENVKTFDWLKSELVGEDLVGPVAPRSLNRADAFEAFTEGDVGMLNGHPTLMKAAEDKGVKFGMVPMPGEDGPTRISMGVADWMMAFKQNGHAEEAGDFLDFVYEDENVLEFSRRYDLLPVTMPVWDVMSEAKEDAHLKPFLEALPTSELYPVGRTSWAAVNAEIKKKIGGAVAYGGDPATVLGELQARASKEETAE
ncbi:MULTISPECIES: extracellular solute-binding protein [Streptomyces]|uniref:Extracellular solute-binding protein n=1 Tax=Streptomyces fuscus TaxID=3048495 RepID=A0ABT7J1R2_9ACTN|nr:MULTISPECIES: extracellular solute-binding protein [Streptomyces]MCM1968858.1 extracellular solute-binding protein [Streptomyces sp. G1]MDL2078796.1 extracellular solute-binding protein [Streptomyces fuscus]SBT91986.1 carbohydrate ABC transporter substrate-binding protein, CUT1 family [Streptomyces sp. DI166]